MKYIDYKRINDITLSILLLVILFPVLLLLALLIIIDSKGFVLYIQKRLGRNGKVFNMYKYRSMVVDAEKQGVYSGKSDARVTKVGKIIRATSIDELPQLVNIMLGDMSFIGPRPPLTYHPWQYDHYTDAQKKMFMVRPGLTGWAQINGRKDVEWNKRIEMNVWYVEHMSFWLDCKILLKTVVNVVLMKDNVNSDKTTTILPNNDEKLP